MTRYSFGLLEIAVAFAALVFVPLGMQLLPREPAEALIGPARRNYRMWFWAGPIAAVVSLVLPRGAYAGLFASIWLAWSVAELRAVFPNARRALRDLGSACGIAARAYLVVGGAWLVASRMGVKPMGFQEPIVLLTALHFHYAGFAGPVLAWCAGKLFEPGETVRDVYRVFAVLILITPGALALAFVWNQRLKLIAALLVAASHFGLGLGVISRLGRLKSRAARALLGISCASALFAMTLAGSWAVGEFTGRPHIDLSGMAKWHGVTNALGLVCCGMLGWLFELRGKGWR